MEFHRVCADIDLDAIVENTQSLMANTPKGTKLMAVVKANAYGHGDVAVARALESEAEYFAVATLPEAVNLRKNGIKKPVLVLGYVFPAEYRMLIENDIDAVVFDMETALELSDEAAKLGKTAYCHIKCDTGMRRIGFEPDNESADIVEKINELPYLKIKGIFTHFAASDEKDKTGAKRQFDTFKEFVNMCEKRGVSFSYRHCANSAASIDMTDTCLDMVRLGISMYGMYPSDDVDKSRVSLTQAMTLKAKVVMVKDVPPGEGISYGGTFVTKNNTRVATVSIGYGEGYPRRLSNKGEVLVHGKRAPILGRVCMDQIMIDVTHIPETVRGDDVILTGREAEEFISIEELCEKAPGAFNYEFVCDIGKRVPRRYFYKGRCVGIHDNFYEKWDLDRF